MAKAPYLDEDSIKSSKPKGLSFFASLLSLFIYIYIFYFFNLSPATVFNNTIFWFLMSNTLILIIAADYGAFSSSKKKQDIYLYEEYVKHSRARNYVPLSYVPRYQQVEEKHVIDIKQAELGGELLLENNNKETIAAKSEVSERVLEIVLQNDPKKRSDHSEASEEKPIPERALRRCKSDRHDRNKRVVIDESKNIVRKSETMKMDEGIRVEEENEFSSMTNEELNRRVEEFIQRFNRQIRLQAAATNMH